MSDRIQSLAAFWPYYLSEHRSPTSRRLHFVGTTGWLLACVASAVSNPVFFPPALLLLAVIGWDAVRREHKGRPLLHLVLMLAFPIAASPVIFPAGVVFAYGCAWVGHFRIEHNRPATFYYPVWSLTCDLRMWSHMLRGRLWDGDPLLELGLQDSWSAAAST